MPEHGTRPHDAHLHQLTHDIRHCLHVIGLGTEMLKSARADESRFAELCEAIEQERETARRLVDEMLAAAFARGDTVT